MVPTADPALQAELYLCLARAFLAPAPGHAEALRDLLADDLADLGVELDLPIQDLVTDFRAEARRLPAPQDWLQVYSALFIAVPVPARINTGYYLDGAVDGGSVCELERLYARAGLARREGFHDLADHVAAQLEFAAALLAPGPCVVSLAQDGPPLPGAGEFLHAFAGQWIDSFCRDVAAGGRGLPANPYLPLAGILREAVARDAVAPELDPREERHRRAMERARGRYASRGVTAEDLEEIRRRLERNGLSAAHLPRTPEEAARRLGRPLAAH